MNRWTIIFIILITASLSCKKNTLTPPQAPSEAILFSSGYQNYAWAPIHQETFLTNTGKVYTFFSDTYLPNDTVQKIKNDNIITQAEMQQLLLVITPVNRTIPADTMAALASLLETITASTSATQGCGADMGAWFSLAYQSTSDTTYRTTLLLQRGDMFKKNISPNAYLLLTYLSKCIGASADTSACR
jgi:hypothetical protein